MDIAGEVAKAVGESIAPIAENAVATITKEIRGIVREELMEKLSGKEITIVIKLPTL